MRRIESAFVLGRHDGFLNSHTTIRLVLSNSSENCNPKSTRLSNFGMEGAVTFSSNTSPNLSMESTEPNEEIARAKGMDASLRTTEGLGRDRDQFR